MAQGAVQPTLVHLAAAETFVLSGKLSHTSGPWRGCMSPGTWGYAPAGSKMRGTKAEQTTEYLAHFYGPVAYLDEAGRIKALLTASDVRQLAATHDVQLAPNTLAEAIRGRRSSYRKPGTPLEIVRHSEDFDSMATRVAESDDLEHPHYIDTTRLPWIVDPRTPQVAIKILRVSAETGTTSLLVRQDHLGSIGEGLPHCHLGPADLFLLEGNVRYGAGTKSSYGPGTYIWEPAGSRHETKERVVEDHLLYMSNIHGPLAFDNGVGTPVVSVVSWMTYAQIAKEKHVPLVASRFANDSATYLATEPALRARL
eukprot:TRINITY_DN8907_c0_g1_i5.p1 TRINITY_DN8907_c0_g1~~TRINITY_DN8907_c0_g1_i5.p1  ORF type:complete len:311 (+),score=14.35 TRINITY_DN8907_c0_g1_i5:511-1443(+)